MNAMECIEAIDTAIRADLIAGAIITGVLCGISMAIGISVGRRREKANKSDCHE